jgi:hypothetical protein
MVDTLILVILFFAIITTIFFVLLLAWRVKSYKDINKNQKVKNGELILETWRVGLGLSFLRLPLGFYTQNRTFSLNIAFFSSKFRYGFVRMREKSYSEIKLIDAFPNFLLGNYLVIHFKGSIATFCANIVRKDALIKALKFLDGKGCKLSKRAKKMIGQIA